jgi:hypothetical protein
MNNTLFAMRRFIMPPWFTRAHWAQVRGKAPIEYHISRCQSNSTYGSRLAHDLLKRLFPAVQTTLGSIARAIFTKLERRYFCA